MSCLILEDLWCHHNDSDEYVSFDFLLKHSIDNDSAVTAVDGTMIPDDGRYTVLIHSNVLSFYKDKSIIHDIEFDNNLQTVTLDNTRRFILVRSY
jgi:hypothetical protein